MKRDLTVARRRLTLRWGIERRDAAPVQPGYIEGPSHAYHAHHAGKRGGKGQACAIPLKARGMESKSITVVLGKTPRRFAPISDRNHPASLIAFTPEQLIDFAGIRTQSLQCFGDHIRDIAKYLLRILCILWTDTGTGLCTRRARGSPTALRLPPHRGGEPLPRLPLPPLWRLCQRSS